MNWKWWTVEPKPTRDAANVIADAVVTAKDTQIADAEHELAVARQEAVDRRRQLAVVLRAARQLHREILEAGAAFEQGIGQAIGAPNHDDEYQ